MACALPFFVFALAVIPSTSVRLDDKDAIKEPDEIATIIVDISDTTIKAGFAGEETPRVSFPFVIGEMTRQKEFPWREPHQHQPWGDILFGNDALNHRPQTSIKIDYPDSFEPHATEMFQYIFSRLEFDTDETLGQVMVIVSPVASNMFQERLLMLMMETFQFQAVMIASPMPLALWSVGRSTGLAMLVGGGRDAVAQPVWEYRGVPDHSVHFDVSGREVVKCQGSLLRKEDPAMTSIESPRAIQKATSAFWTSHPRVQSDASEKTDAHTRCPEALFQPSAMSSVIRIESGAVGIQETAVKCINDADADIREEVAGSIVVIGSYSGIPGLKKRLEKDIQALFPATSAVKAEVLEGDAWRGGSRAAAAHPMPNYWVSTDLYEEWGSEAVRHYRFF